MNYTPERILKAVFLVSTGEHSPFHTRPVPELQRSTGAISAYVH
jgi:hypothetical protein